MTQSPQDASQAQTCELRLGHLFLERRCAPRSLMEACVRERNALLQPQHLPSHAMQVTSSLRICDASVTRFLDSVPGSQP
eukprot:1033764-Rhodomonas_salina.2